MLRGEGPLKPEFAYNNIRIHSLMIYTNLIKKRVSSDLMEFAAREIAEALSGRKSFKSAASSVGRHTLKK